MSEQFMWAGWLNLERKTKQNKLFFVPSGEVGAKDLGLIT